MNINDDLLNKARKQRLFLLVVFSAMVSLLGLAFVIWFSIFNSLSNYYSHDVTIAWVFKMCIRDRPWIISISVKSFGVSFGICSTTILKSILLPHEYVYCLDISLTESD